MDLTLHRCESCHVVHINCIAGDDDERALLAHVIDLLPPTLKAEKEQLIRFNLENLDGCLSHVRPDGFVQGVCGAPWFNALGRATEGQAFFILMEAAFNALHRVPEG